MEELKNTKQVSELITETANLKGVGSITLQGDKLIDLSLRFTKKEDKSETTVTTSKGTINYKVSKEGMASSVEKINVMMNEIHYECRNEIREELNRLLDKYDGITVINEEA